MSPKYRLRSANPFIAYRKSTGGHTIFLPLAMLAVVGGTALLVKTTQPLSLILEPEWEILPLTPREIPPPARPEKIEVQELPLNLAKINRFRNESIPLPAPEPAGQLLAGPLPERTNVPEKFVSTEWLAVLEPLPELHRAIQVADAILNRDSGLESPESAYRSGLPKPKSNAKPLCPAETTSNAYQAPVIPCEVNSGLGMAELMNHELQRCLPGNNQRLKIGEFFEDPSKAQQLGRHLLTELANGSVLNGSFEAHPRIQLELSLERGEIPQARLVSENSICHSAVPILKSISPKGSFTPWMTPDELNHHILSKSCGRGKSFWDQGHWITSIEGRVCSSGNQQFRIVCAPTPKGRNFQWRYWIAQTREDFNEKLEAGKKSGYELVQSQMFVDPTNIPRFQAVWHRM